MIGGLVAIGGTSLLANSTAAGADKSVSNLLVVEKAGIVLWHWSYEYYGATIDVDFVYYPAENKFCLEGDLRYKGVIKIADGDVCIVKSDNGDIGLSVRAEIKIAGKKVAKMSGEGRWSLDWNAGKIHMRSYRFEVCGTNTFELKCKTWEHEYTYGAKDSHVMPLFGSSRYTGESAGLGLLTMDLPVRLID
jgi:hypothetical protein